MIKRLQTIPETWLNLNICRDIYEAFKAKSLFHEPLPDFNDRYSGKLEAVLGSIEGSYGGLFFYPTVLEAAAAYLVKVNCRHPFVNGNKRISVLFTDIFLYLNDFDLRVPYEDMFHLSAVIASYCEKGIAEEKLMQLSQSIIADFTEDVREK